MLFNSFSSAYVGGVRFARIFLLLFAVNASSDIRILYEVHFNQYIQNHRWNLSGFLTTGIVVPVPSMSKTRACARRCMENEYVASMSLETITNRFNKKRSTSGTTYRVPCFWSERRNNSDWQQHSSLGLGAAFFHSFFLKILVSLLDQVKKRQIGGFEHR